MRANLLRTVGPSLRPPCRCTSSTRAHRPVRNTARMPHGRLNARGLKAPVGRSPQARGYVSGVLGFSRLPSRPTSIIVNKTAGSRGIRPALYVECALPAATACRHTGGGGGGGGGGVSQGNCSKCRMGGGGGGGGAGMGGGGAGMGGGGGGGGVVWDCRPAPWSAASRPQSRRRRGCGPCPGPRCTPWRPAVRAVGAVQVVGAVRAGQGGAGCAGTRVPWTTGWGGTGGTRGWVGLGWASGSGGAESECLCATGR